MSEDMFTSTLDMSSVIGRETTTPAEREAEKEANDPNTKHCAKCQKPQSDLPSPLKRCAKCQTQCYCSRECQKADWKTHKKICATNQQRKPKAMTDFDAMPAPARDFFKGVSPDDFLHKLPEKDTFIRLIDCYRMRVEDDYKFAGDARGLYAEDDPLEDFQEFLDLAVKRKGLLPKWWNERKRAACERLAVDATQWAFLGSAVEKSDVIEHYGDSLMPMKLRILAEKIYGKKIDMGY